jgi:broad specificity phosphatase PhoE
MHTAELFAAEVNYPVKDIIVIEELIERGFSDLEGKNMELDFGVHETKYYEEPLSVDHIQNIETISQLHKRAEKVFEALKSTPKKNC